MVIDCAKEQEEPRTSADSFFLYSLRNRLVCFHASKAIVSRGRVPLRKEKFRAKYPTEHDTAVLQKDLISAWELSELLPASECTTSFQAHRVSQHDCIRA